MKVRLVFLLYFALLATACSRFALSEEPEKVDHYNRADRVDRALNDPSNLQGQLQPQTIAETDSWTDVPIPSVFQSHSSSGDTVIRQIEVYTDSRRTSTVTGQIRFIYNENDGDKLIRLSISHNIFADTDLDPTFWVISEKELPGIGECLEDCDSLAKKWERIGCKILCWGLPILTAASLIKDIFD